MSVTFFPAIICRTCCDSYGVVERTPAKRPGCFSTFDMISFVLPLCRNGYDNGLLCQSQTHRCFHHSPLSIPPLRKAIGEFKLMSLVIESWLLSSALDFTLFELALLPRQFSQEFENLCILEMARSSLGHVAAPMRGLNHSEEKRRFLQASTAFLRRRGRDAQS